jgi:hypothetical protein
MAKTIGVAVATALPRPEKRRTIASIAGLARRTASLLLPQQDKEIETFIRHRGGVMNDAVERELSRHLGRM